MAVATIAERSKNGESADGRKRAFIAAPWADDTRVIRQILANRGYTPFSADELDLPGRPIEEIIRESLEDADLVVGFIGENVTPNVFWELGFAQALGKRIIVFAKQDVPPLNWPDESVPYVRADDKNPQAIEFALTQFLKAPQHGERASKAPVARTHALGNAVDQLLVRLHTETSPKSLETIVADAIRLSGAPIVSTSEAEDRGLDIAVWSDDLGPWVSNPLLIAVKHTLRADSIEQTGRKLTDAASSANVPWVLLVYRNATGNVDESLAGFSGVLAIEAQYFLESLRDCAFSDVVRNLRNKRVHGAR